MSLPGRKWCIVSSFFSYVVSVEKKVQVAATSPSDAQAKLSSAVKPNTKGGLSLEDMKKIFGVSAKSEPKNENNSDNHKEEDNTDKVCYHSLCFPFYFIYLFIYLFFFLLFI